MPISEIRSRHALTLIELLTVVAIIGILAGILIPTVTSVRVLANQTKTKVQFNQWAAAIESFRSEYGYYPVFDPSNLVNPAGQGVDPTSVHLFHDILAARRRNGSPLPELDRTTPAMQPEAQNRKRIAFYRFGEGDLSGADTPAANLVQDAFGHTEIAVLVDRNLDGKIDSADYGGSLPLVGGLRPASADFPPTGIRARVGFYTAKPGADATNPEFIFSWK